MTQPRPFDELLESWLEEGPATAPQDLLESAYVDIPATYHQRRRFSALRRLNMLASTARFVAAAAAVIVIGVVGFALLFRGNPGVGGTGESPTPSPTDVAVVSPTPEVTPEITPEATTPFCLPEDLSLQVTMWEGAAGHRIATVVMTNSGSAPCNTLALDRPQLVQGAEGANVLINGAPPEPSATLTLAAGGTLQTLVQDSNYCGPDVSTGPVTVAFILSSGTGRVVAAPVSATDLDGIPPCNATPGSAGTIEMHPWAP
jgi:hypothetical protein